MHPLSGSDPATFARVLWHNGLPRSGRNWGRTLLAAGAVLGRAPFTLVEQAWARRRLARDAAPQAPVFILGHWRSGTTHLYNVMARRGFKRRWRKVVGRQVEIRQVGDGEAPVHGTLPQVSV